MLRSRWVLHLACVVGALAAVPATAAVRLPDDFVNEVLLTGLNQPNSMAFLPDGRLLFTEQRTGKVRLVVNGHLAATDPVLVVPQLNAGGYERGLQGIAVDPRWPSRPYVYLFHNRVGNANRLVRYKAAGDLTDPLGESLTLSSPLLLIDDIVDNDPNHNSGCLRFAPDGSLFLTVGEDEDFCAANDPTRLKGAMLRLDVMRLGDAAGGPVPRDSITPGDNPLTTTDPNARLVYAYGMRNPWRFEIDPVTGDVFAGDVGEDIQEELDQVHPGDDLGWPWREGNAIVERENCPEPGGPGAHPYVPPIVALPREPQLAAIFSIGPYRQVPGAPANWPPSYDGDVFYGEYYSGRITRLEKTGPTWSVAAPESGQPGPTTWGDGAISSVDALVGPDGSLWWIRQFDESLNGETGSLQRIRFVGQFVQVPPRDAGLALAGHPNPFSGEATIGFRMAAPGYVRLELLDAGGRLVRRLLDAGVTAGDQRVPWDARDAAGRSVSPGVYFVRLETPHGVEAIRLLRLR